MKHVHEFFKTFMENAYYENICMDDKLFLYPNKLIPYTANFLKSPYI